MDLHEIITGAVAIAYPVLGYFVKSVTTKITDLGERIKELEKQKEKAVLENEKLKGKIESHTFQLMEIKEIYNKEAEQRTKILTSMTSVEERVKTVFGKLDKYEQYLIKLDTDLDKTRELFQNTLLELTKKRES